MVALSDALSCSSLDKTTLSKMLNSSINLSVNWCGRYVVEVEGYQDSVALDVFAAACLKNCADSKSEFKDRFQKLYSDASSKLYNAGFSTYLLGSALQIATYNQNPFNS